MQIYDRNFTAIDCTTGASRQLSWGPEAAGFVDARGNWGPFAVPHADYGSYHYEIDDDAGHVVHLDITYSNS